MSRELNYRTVNEYKVGDSLIVKLNKLNDNPVHINIVRVAKDGKTKNVRRIQPVEWSELAKVIPEVQVGLDADAKVVAAEAKAKSNGGKDKATTKKTPTKAVVKSKATTKKAPAKKATTKKTAAKPVTKLRKGGAKKGVTDINDLL
jgi:hypothetical protein